MGNTNSEIVDLRDVERKLSRHVADLREALDMLRSKVDNGLYFAELDNPALFYPRDRNGKDVDAKGRPLKSRLEKDVLRILGAVEKLPERSVGDKIDGWVKSGVPLEENTLRLLKEWQTPLAHSSDELWALVIDALQTGKLYNSKERKLPEDPEEFSDEDKEWIKWRVALITWFARTNKSWPRELRITPPPARLTVSAGAVVSLQDAKPPIDEETKQKRLRHLAPVNLRPDLVASKFNQPTGKLPVGTGSTVRWAMCRYVMENSEGWSDERPIDLIDDLIPKRTAEDKIAILYKKDNRWSKWFTRSTGKKIRDRLSDIGFHAIYELLTIKNDDGSVLYQPPPFEEKLGQGHFEELKGVLANYDIQFGEVGKSDRPESVWIRFSPEVKEGLSSFDRLAKAVEEWSQEKTKDRFNPAYDSAKGQAEVYIDGQRRVEDIH